MREINYTKVVIVLSALLLAFAVPARAGTPVTKLGRGLSNVGGGWLELYHQMKTSSDESGPLAGATTGLLKGALMTVYRTAIGAYETVTFFVPAPPDYGPIIYPEYVPIKEGYNKPVREPNIY